MKKLILIFLLSLTPIWAQVDLVNKTYKTNRNIRFVISADQQSYTVGQPILVNVTIRNTGIEPITIQAYGEPFLSYQFSIYDSYRNLISNKIPFQHFQTNLLKPELQKEREITLFPNEAFSTKINLNTWMNLTNQGRYLIQANFMYNKQKIFSTPLFITLKPSKKIIAHLKMEEIYKEREAKRTFTPQGTVEFILNAEKNKDWESFFKYLDLEKLVLIYKPYSQLYKKAFKSTKKASIINDFKTWLKNQPETQNLEAYKLQNIVFTDNPKQRIIYCYVRYSKKVIPNNYLYKYSLKQKGNKWYLRNIESFVAKNNLWEQFDYTDIELSKKE